jgi:hypothetical protein
MHNIVASTYFVQSELEHRTPKGRFKRTDRKGFVKQMACIERRQARIRRIRARFQAGSSTQRETVAKTPQEHHHIGLSQNQHQHMGTFLLKNIGDPAVKVSAMIAKIHGSKDYGATGLPTETSTASPPPYVIDAPG